eukprot:gene1029-618_t
MEMFKNILISANVLGLSVTITTSFQLGEKLVATGTSSFVNNNFVLNKNGASNKYAGALHGKSVRKLLTAYGMLHEDPSSSFVDTETIPNAETMDRNVEEAPNQQPPPAAPLPKKSLCVRAFRCFEGKVDTCVGLCCFAKDRCRSVCSKNERVGSTRNCSENVDSPPQQHSRVPHNSPADDDFRATSCHSQPSAQHTSVQNEQAAKRTLKRKGSNTILPQEVVEGLSAWPTREEVVE